MFPQNKLLNLVTILLVFFYSNQNFAANKNKPETIDIKAHYLLLDEKKGVSKYTGNVLFKKNTLVIKADSITLYYDGDELTKAIIVGSPADIEQQPDNEAKVHSQANNIEYFVDEDRLILQGQAFVDQGDRHFSGETIEYDTRQRSFSAVGAKNKENDQSKARVHVIIGPTEDDEIEDDEE